MTETGSTVERLHSTWFTRSNGWDRGIDHAVTDAELDRGGEGRTLCGRKLGRGYVPTGDSFKGNANYECKQCRRALHSQASDEGKP